MAVATTDWMDAVSKLPSRTLGRSAAPNRIDAGLQARFGADLKAAKQADDAALRDIAARKQASAIQSAERPIRATKAPPAADRSPDPGARDRTASRTSSDAAPPVVADKSTASRTRDGTTDVPGGKPGGKPGQAARDDGPTKDEKAADSSGPLQPTAQPPQPADPNPVQAPPSPEQAALAAGAVPTSTGATTEAPGGDAASQGTTAATAGAAAAASIPILLSSASSTPAPAAAGIDPGGSAAGTATPGTLAQAVPGTSSATQGGEASAGPDAVPAEGSVKTDAPAAGTPTVDKPDFLAALADATQGLPVPDAGAVRAPAAPAHLPAAAEKAAAQNAAPAVPIGQVPMTIGLRSLAGSSQFEIRLDPAELGRIDVKLEIDKERGTVMTHMVVERIDTLAMLQRDAGSLQQALSQAGLDASEGSISLSLRGDGSAGGGKSGDRDGQSRSGGAWTGDSADAASPIDIAPLRSLRGLGGLDIRI